MDSQTPSHLKRFLADISQNNLRRFLWFVTEQDIIPTSGLLNPNMFTPHRDKITVECTPPSPSISPSSSSSSPPPSSSPPSSSSPPPPSLSPSLLSSPSPSTPTALPVAHVCFYKLDLPDYNDYEVLKTKLLLAISNTSTFELQ